MSNYKEYGYNWFTWRADGSCNLAISPCVNSAAEFYGYCKVYHHTPETKHELLNLFEFIKINEDTAYFDLYNNNTRQHKHLKFDEVKLIDHRTIIYNDETYKTDYYTWCTWYNDDRSKEIKVVFNK